MAGDGRKPYPHLSAKQPDVLSYRNPETKAVSLSEFEHIHPGQACYSEPNAPDEKRPASFEQLGISAAEVRNVSKVGSQQNRTFESAVYHRPQFDTRYCGPLAPNFQVPDDPARANTYLVTGILSARAILRRIVRPCIQRSQVLRDLLCAEPG
jgi:hypothetical protein